jgi:hypothetical protein
VRPESRAGSGAQAGAQAGGGNVGARKAAGDDVHRRDLAPIDGGDVAEVRHPRVVLFEHPHSGRFKLAIPGELDVQLDVQHDADTHFEAAIAGEQRPNRVGHEVTST